MPRKTWHVPVGAALIVIIVVLLAISLSSCSGKALEPFNDSKVGTQNKGPADVINMPDGFSNVATKCDHGNRIYVIFHSDGAYGSIAVRADDPTCVGK
jgi:hypothetical protein